MNIYKRRITDKLDPVTNTRTRKIHDTMVVLATLSILVSPFIIHQAFKYFDNKLKIQVTGEGFFEDALSDKSEEYQIGQTVSTEQTDFKLLNFYPYTDLGVRIDPCTDLTIKDIRVSKKAQMAFLALTMKGKHFCPSTPKIVISKDKDVAVTLSATSLDGKKSD